jgi:hypothetical protein
MGVSVGVDWLEMKIFHCNIRYSSNQINPYKKKKKKRKKKRGGRGKK